MPDRSSALLTITPIVLGSFVAAVVAAAACGETTSDSTSQNELLPTSIASASSAAPVSTTPQATTATSAAAPQTSSAQPPASITSPAVGTTAVPALSSVLAISSEPAMSSQPITTSAPVLSSAPATMGIATSSGPSSTSVPTPSSSPDPTATSSATAAATTSAAPTHSGAWKIMPLGDSTTAATCVRQQLWKKLADAGKMNIDFVGGSSDSGCSDAAPANFDTNHEGHSCYIVSNLVNTGNKPSCGSGFSSTSADLATWFDNQTPDIVLMHFGTNDAWNGYGPDMILPAYTAILDKVRSESPHVHFFVAQIIPLQPDTNDTKVKALNAAIPAWATEHSTADSPITVVDQFTGYVVATDNQSDGVHPNSTGSAKIAQKWFDAIAGLL